MLTESQVNSIWQKMYAAEVRSLYFGDLAAAFTKRKQIITGVSFALSSSAAASLAAKAPDWVPILTTSLSAAITAYSIAVGLDRKAATTAKLLYQWSQISTDFKTLWNHWGEDGAEERMESLLLKSRDATVSGSSDDPYDKSRIERWQERVNLLHGRTT